MGHAPVRWRALGAVATGAAHERRGAGCEDAYGYARLPGGLLLLAVADGAGSASRAAEGARCAVTTALGSLDHALRTGAPPLDGPRWRTLLETALAAAHAALNEVARTETYAPDARELATTLLLVAVSPRCFAAAQVGDGAIALRVAGGEPEIPLHPPPTEYPNETTFITGVGWREDARYAVRCDEDVDAVALLSDGLELLAVEGRTREPHAPFFRPLWSYAARGDAAPEELARFLRSERVAARTDDDRALVLAVRERDVPAP